MGSPFWPRSMCRTSTSSFSTEVARKKRAGTMLGHSRDAPDTDHHADRLPTPRTGSSVWRSAPTALSQLVTVAESGLLSARHAIVAIAIAIQDRPYKKELGSVASAQRSAVACRKIKHRWITPWTLKEDGGLTWSEVLSCSLRWSSSRWSAPERRDGSTTIDDHRCKPWRPKLRATCTHIATV